MDSFFDRRGAQPRLDSRHRFAAFEETSLFDQETANRFRTEIPEVSGSKDYMEMWVNFRGREPEIEPLLRNLGLQ